jgi:hypothetical protein
MPPTVRQAVRMRRENPLPRGFRRRSAGLPIALSAPVPIGVGAPVLWEGGPAQAVGRSAGRGGARG